MRFYDSKFAEIYHSRLKKEGYPASLWKPLREAAGLPPASLIDIGAGTGFFSIPLAAEGFIVTAVEPSAAMTDIMRREMGGALSSNLSIENSTWEERQGAKADISISVHSLYPMADPSAAVHKMISQSEKRIIIVRDDKEQWTLSDAVRAEFNEKRSVKNLGDGISSLLKSSAIPFSIRTITEKKVNFFFDPEEEAEYYIFFLKLDPGIKDRLTAFLKKITSFIDGRYIYESRHSDLLLEF